MLKHGTPYFISQGDHRAVQLNKTHYRVVIVLKNIERQQRTTGDGLHAAGQEVGRRRKNVFAAVVCC